MSYRLGVDVGGTFTDFLLLNEESGETHTAKVPSTPEAESRAAKQETVELDGSKPWVVHSAGPKSEPCAHLVVRGAPELRSSSDAARHLGACLELAGVVSWEGRTCVVSAASPADVPDDRGSFLGAA